MWLSGRGVFQAEGRVNTIEPGSHALGTARRPVRWKGVQTWGKREMCSEALRAKLCKTAPFISLRGAQGLQKQTQ